MDARTRRRALAVAGLFGLASIAFSQTVKLNGPLPQPVGGSIFRFEISPDGTRIVYQADQDTDDVFDLYSVPVDGNQAPVKLNTLLPSGEVDFESGFEISPDSNWVVYRAYHGFGTRLHCVPIDGSASPVPLDLPAEGASQGDTSPDFVFNASSDHVLLFNETVTLNSAPLDGGSGALLADGYTPGNLVRMTPDGLRVLYAFRNSPPWNWRLFSVPLDGSAGSIQINGALQSAGNVLGLEVGPDGTRALYLADQETDGVNELYCVPTDGSGPAVKLSAALAPGTDVGRFWFSADGSEAVYTVDQGTHVQLYGVPVDGSASALALNSIPGPSSSVLELTPRPDRGRVVYRSDHASPGVFELFSLTIEGNLPPVRLNGALAAGGDVVQFTLSADGRRVVYRADQDADELFELFSIPIEGRFRKFMRPGTSPLVQLNAPLVAGGDVIQWEISSDGAWVAYRADQDENDVLELYSVPIHGGAAIRLNGPLTPGEDIAGFQVGSDHVAFVAPGLEGPALYGVPIDRGAEPVVLNLPLPLGPILGDVHMFEVSADGSRAVYMADQDQDFVDELYVAPTNGSAPSLKLNAPLVAGGDVGNGVGSPPLAGAFRISPDGERVVYMADQDVLDLNELFSVPIDGGTPLKLHAGTYVVHGLEFGADGRVVYRTVGPTGLYSVKADGSEAPIHIAASEADPLQLSADGSRVVYLNSFDRLYSARVDGGGVPVNLHTLVFADREVTKFGISADSSRVVYLVDAAANGLYELYSAGIAGGPAPFRLNTGLSVDRDVVAFAIGGGARVAYVADQDQNDVFELYSVPIDASPAPLKLNSVLVAGGDVTSDSGAFQVSPDGMRVVYVADQEVDGVFELYSVPIDASSTPVKLNGPLVGGGDVGLFPNYFAISPDATRVVYVANQDLVAAVELYSVPIQGGSSPVRLNAPFVAGRNVDTFAIDRLGWNVVYVADQETDFVSELYRVPIDGSEGPEKLNEPLAGPGTMSFVISSDARRVVYRAEQDTGGVVELYATVVDKALPAPAELQGPVRFP